MGIFSNHSYNLPYVGSRVSRVAGFRASWALVRLVSVEQAPNKGPELTSTPSTENPRP